jgi:hypothetical protein
MQRILVTVWLLVVVGFGAPGRPSLAKPARAQGRTTPAVQVDMRNVIYHFTDQIAVHIHQLQGRVLPTPRARFPVFDDVESFTFAIAFAEIALSTETLSHILNHYVFAAPDAPLKEIAVTTTGNMRLKVQGKLHTTGGLPFTTEGTPAVTPEGSIRLRTHTITVASVPVKGLLDVLGVKLAQLINTAKVPGVRLEGNDLLLDPAQLLPPPRIAGRVTAVHVHGEQILQVFGTTPPVGAPPRPPGELHGVPGCAAPLWQAHDGGDGPGAHRFGPGGSLRFLAGALQGTSGSGVCENDRRGWSPRVHARFQQTPAPTASPAPADAPKGPSRVCEIAGHVFDLGHRVGHST